MVKDNFSKLVEKKALNLSNFMLRSSITVQDQELFKEKTFL